MAEQQITERWEFDRLAIPVYEAVRYQYVEKKRIAYRIIDCPSTDMALSDEDRLKKYGLTECTLLPYGSMVVEAAEQSPEQRATEVGGRTLSVMTPNGRSSVIFMRTDYPAASEAGREVIRICILFHELGHADDLHQGITFNHETMMNDVDKAEEYADQFAKKHLSRVRAFRIVNGVRTQSNLWEYYEINRPAIEYQRLPDETSQS